MQLSPKEHLEKTINQFITLYLRKKKKYFGKLLGIDEHFNILLEDAYELNENVRIEIGTALINGGTITAIEFTSSEK